MEQNYTQCAEIKKMSEQLTKLLVEYPMLEKRVLNLEDKTGKHSDQISELVKNQAETKVYVKQILSKIDGLDNQLLTFLKQITNNATKERIEDRKADREERKDYNKERGSTTTQFLGFAKYVVGATIGALIAGAVAYIKIKG